MTYYVLEGAGLIRYHRVEDTVLATLHTGFPSQPVFCGFVGDVSADMSVGGDAVAAMRWR